MRYESCLGLQLLSATYPALSTGRKCQVLLVARSAVPNSLIGTCAGACHPLVVLQPFSLAFQPRHGFALLVLSRHSYQCFLPSFFVQRI